MKRLTYSLEKHRASEGYGAKAVRGSSVLFIGSANAEGHGSTASFIAWTLASTRPPGAREGLPVPMKPNSCQPIVRLRAKTNGDERQQDNA